MHPHDHPRNESRCDEHEYALEYGLRGAFESCIEKFEAEREQNGGEYTDADAAPNVFPEDKLVGLRKEGEHNTDYYRRLKRFSKGYQQSGKHLSTIPQPTLYQKSEDGAVCSKQLVRHTELFHALHQWREDFLFCQLNADERGTALAVVL